MKTVNRSAVLITPRKPYLEWAGTTDDDAKEHVLFFRDRTTVYFVEAAETPSQELRILKRHIPEIFAAELAAWITDEDVWPSNRDVATFREWFTVRFESLVFDLADGDLEHD